MKILIDTGHCLSGADTGAQGCGYREENLTREIGARVIEKLRDLGHTAICVSPDYSNSLGESLAYRVNKANSEGGDIFISIHLNASNGEGHGTEIFTYNSKELEQARNILNNIVSLGYTNRGIKDGSGLYVVRNTHMVAMLIECCFIDNIDDMAKFSIEDISNAIVDGIVGETSHNEVVEPPTQETTDIKELQHEINVQGFGDIAEDNIPGPITLSHCPTIRKGARGNITRILQQILINRGYSCGNAGADGVFGEGTYKAVIAFQDGNRLDADGIVGQNTWRAILGL